MLLFVGREPNAGNEQDGMAQRVKSIDDRFLDTPRTILSIAFKRNLRRRRIQRSETLTVEQVNALMHLFHIWMLVWKSRTTYVHSCYNACTILPLYLFKKRIITDMHGVVPEEELLKGNIWRSRVLGIVEKVVLRRSAAVVFVTEAMKGHFQAKYQLSAEKQHFTIPILPSGTCNSSTARRQDDLVIYAGGLQTWQRVDRMLEVAEMMSGQYRFLFLTGSPELLKAKLHNIGTHDIKVDSVPNAAIAEFYGRASYGFLLRDNSIINRVACPTKLVEYMRAGVIPIVEQPLIGDFEALGYRYILVKDFLEDAHPCSAECEIWRKQNTDIVSTLEAATLEESEKLRQALTGK